ncbi:MAG: ECF transporter S component [bacterium]|nr:ECF transporter S component [bacterium]
MKKAAGGSADRKRETNSKPAQGAEALAISAVCIALGVVIPFFIHPFGWSPRVILPMHFPVFLGGMLLGPVSAALVGVFTPALSMGLTGMPTAAQTLRMMPELAVYGVTTSLMLQLLPALPGLPKRAGRIAALGIAMLVAMVAGRLTYVAVSMLTAGIQDFHYYMLILIIPGIPGMIAQLVIVPPLAYKLQRVMDRS